MILTLISALLSDTIILHKLVAQFDSLASMYLHCYAEPGYNYWLAIQRPYPISYLVKRGRSKLKWLIAWNWRQKMVVLIT